MNWWKESSIRVKAGVPLKKYTAFKIGGEAEFFIQPRSLSNLKLLLKKLKRYKIPLLVLGSGSNVLADSRGIEGAVVKLSGLVFTKIALRKKGLTAGSSAQLARLVVCARSRGLSGLEFLTGIPGTLGGALAMNAGAWGKNIADLVEKVRVMDYNGKLKTLKKKEVRFGYRSSSLDKYIILGASLKLVKGNKNTIAGRIRGYLLRRKDTQDLSLPSAGCVFKNPRGNSAGSLVELCGLKGRAAGGARISGKHANFILNQGNACSGDVLKLMRLMQEQVKNKFGIVLEPEIKIWH